MAVAIVALVCAMSGLAWAAIKVDTAQIAPKAVTSGKIDSYAVKRSKINFGAVGERQLARMVAGLPVVGATVNARGEVTSHFNRLVPDPNPPFVHHAFPGESLLSFQGLGDDPSPTEEEEGRVAAGVPLATATAPDTRVSAGWTSPTRGNAVIAVRTYDNSGAPADRPFSYVFLDGERTDTNFVRPAS